MEKNKKIEWYNNAKFITNIILVVIPIIIVLSQSLVSDQISGIKLFQNILNHNINYMIMFVYFISLKTKFGKKYFDYSNIILLLFLFMIFITSTLTVCRSFSVESLISFISSFLILIYFFHTFLRGMRLWKDFKLNKSPFNELSNEWYFSSCVVVEVILFTINLILLNDTSILFISLFDSIYAILFVRYIYLYHTYLDNKKINISNDGNFDEVRETIDELCDKATDKINEIKDNKKNSKKEDK